MGREPDGSESILARHVLAFDLCADGGLVYATGSNIYHVSARGDSAKIGRGQLIERVVALGAK